MTERENDYAIARKVVIFRADGIPGLYDAVIDGREYRDLTTGQLMHLLRQNGFDPAEIVAVPNAR